MRHDDLLGAWVATVIFVLCTLVFVARLAGRERVEYWLGAGLLATALPLVYLLSRAPQYRRPWLYYLQTGLMLAFLAAEFVLDYALRSEFRRVPWAAAAYVTLFFAGTGGMIGIASAAGRNWTISSVLLFLVMATLAFAQHARLGM